MHKTVYTTFAVVTCKYDSFMGVRNSGYEYTLLIYYTYTYESV